MLRVAGEGLCSAWLHRLGEIVFIQAVSALGN